MYVVFDSVESVGIEDSTKDEVFFYGKWIPWTDYHTLNHLCSIVFNERVNDLLISQLRTLKRILWKLEKKWLVFSRDSFDSDGNCHNLQIIKFVNVLKKHYVDTKENLSRFWVATSCETPFAAAAAPPLFAIQSCSGWIQLISRPLRKIVHPPSPKANSLWFRHHFGLELYQLVEPSSPRQSRL